MLAALAAQTKRIRVGLLVTSNRFRPPAILAKIASTVDIISNGRLNFGIGAGSRPSMPIARREYDAHGLPYLDAPDAVASLAETCTLINRLWTDTEPFDFAGTHHHLTGALCNPKPVQQPRPPIVIGGRSKATLRVVEHADVWTYPADDIDDALGRRALLDNYCHDIGRDPAKITASLVLPVDYNDPAPTRTLIARARDNEFLHLVLSLPAPYPGHVSHWVAEQLITASDA